VAVDLERRHRRTRAILTRLSLLAGALLAVSLVSLHLGQDANWDLQNYHFYNPYALVTDRLDWDIAPAQLQTYHNPLADLPFYWAVRADVQPQWIAVLLALPAGIAAFFLFLSLQRLFSGLGVGRGRLHAALALLIGVTGAAGVPLIGTTTNDWPGAMLIVIAIWLLLKSSLMVGREKLLVIAFAGLISGIAAGLKLTTAFYAASLCLTLLLTVRPFRAQAIARAAAFASLALIGFTVTAGFWLWRMYSEFGNPFFPYFNDWFRSPWWDFTALSSGYAPSTPLEWLRFPFRLFRYNAGVVGELAFRDWRVPLALCAAIVFLAMLTWGSFRPRREGLRPEETCGWQFLAVFWLVAFVLWTFEHAVHRYIIPLELFSGAILIMIVLRFLPARAQIAAALVVTGVVIAKTAYPAAPRVPFGQHFFEAKVPKLPANTLVLLVEDAPLAYVIPFLDPSARFAGANNNLVQPGQRNLMARKIARVIKEHRGPLFALQSPHALGEEALSGYGLAERTGTCRTIDTNMPTQPMKLCELTRAPDQK